MTEKFIHSACTRKTDKFQIISEASESNPVPEGCMRLTGTFAVVSTNENKVVNNNNRYYVMENYKEMINRMNKEINEGDGVFGELEHPKTMSLNWDNISHKVEKIELNESTGEVTGTILVLGTPKGKIVQECFRAGMQPRISSRGRGVIHEDGKTILSEMPTYDIVRKSGFQQATMNISESVDGQEVVIMESFEVDIVESGGTSMKGPEMSASDIKKLVKDEVEVAVQETVEKIKNDLGNLSVNEGEQISLDAIQNYCENLIDSRIEVSEMKTQNYVQESMQKLGTAVQSWSVEQFAPQVQSWVVEHYSPEVQKWVVNELVPVVENWTINEFGGQIQNWILEQYSPEVQKWVTESYSPTVQKWLFEEFAPVVENWVKTEFKGSITEEFEASISKIKVNESVTPPATDETVQDAAVNENGDEAPTVTENVTETVEEKKDFLTRIDEELSELQVISESEQEESRKAKEQEAANEAKQAKVLSLMPNSIRHLYEACSDEKKAEIMEQAMMRNFTSDSQIVEFLDSRFSTNSKNDAVKKIMEQSSVSESMQNSLMNFNSRVFG